MDYDAILTQVFTLFHQEQHPAYRILKHRFRLNDDLPGSSYGGSATTNQGYCQDHTPEEHAGRREGTAADVMHRPYTASAGE
jgi:hypothetical protein